jgi:hypothetical protein
MPTGWKRRLFERWIILRNWWDDGIRVGNNERMSYRRWRMLRDYDARLSYQTLRRCRVCNDRRCPG